MNTSIKINNSILGACMMFVGAVMFSAKAIFVKLCYRYQIDASSLLALRMIFSLPFFGGVFVYFFIHNLKKSTSAKIDISQIDWLKIIFLGIIGYYLASIFDFEGLRYVSAGVERLILFVYPTLVVLMSVIFFKKKINRIEIAALVLTYLGVAVVYWHDISGKGSNTELGAFLVFLSALTYAIYLVGSGNLIPKLGAMYFTACAMLVSTVATVVHYFFASNQSLWLHHPNVYIISFFMALFSTVIPGFLVSGAIKHIGASKASIIASVGPVSTIILAYFFLGESFSVYQIVGTVLVLVGVIVVGLNKK